MYKVVHHFMPSSENEVCDLLSNDYSVAVYAPIDRAEL